MEIHAKSPGGKPAGDELSPLMDRQSAAGRKVRERLANRRAHPRIPVNIPAAAHCRGSFRAVRIRNISQGGLMLEGAYGLFVGDRLEVKTLRGRVFSGVVAWALGTHCGVKFDALLEAEDPILAPSAGGREPARG